MTWVYLIQEIDSNGPTKIGVAENVNKRLSQLQSGNSRAMKIERQWDFHRRSDALDVEECVLSLCRARRQHCRGEWISLPADELAGTVEEVIRSISDQVSLSHPDYAEAAQ